MALVRKAPKDAKLEDIAHRQDSDRESEPKHEATPMPAKKRSRAKRQTVERKVSDSPPSAELHDPREENVADEAEVCLEYNTLHKRRNKRISQGSRVRVCDPISDDFDRVTTRKRKRKSLVQTRNAIEVQTDECKMQEHSAIPEQAAASPVPKPECNCASLKIAKKRKRSVKKSEVVATADDGVDVEIAVDEIKKVIRKRNGRGYRTEKSAPDPVVPFRYQQEIIDEMIRRDGGIMPADSQAKSIIHILGSKIGSGKTLCAVKMLERVIADRKPLPTIPDLDPKLVDGVDYKVGTVKIPVPPLVDNFMVTIPGRYTRYANVIPSTLVITNPSITHQWANEFEQNAPGLRVFVVPTYSKKRIWDESWPTKYDVIIIGWSAWSAICESFQLAHVFERIIIDEIVHSKSARFAFANRYWIISSTWDQQIAFPNQSAYPIDLLAEDTLPAVYKKKTKVGDRSVGINIWMMNFLCSKLKDLVQKHVIVDDIKSLVVTCDESEIAEEWKERGVVTSVVDLFHKYRDPEVLAKIMKLVPQSLVVQLQAGDISGAVRAFGTMSGVEVSPGMTLHEILQITFKREIDELKLHQARESALRNFGAVEILESRIKERVSSAHKRIVESVSDECSICMDNKGSARSIHVPCQSGICKTCQEKLDVCPICRGAMNAENIFVVEVSDEVWDKKGVGKPAKRVGVPTKYEVLHGLLASRTPDQRFLLFSAYKQDGLHAVFDDVKLKYKELKGTMEHRRHVIDDFVTGTYDALMIDAKTDSAGVHLVAATDVIILHDMSESDEKQLIGRAVRLGQTKPVRVHRFVTAAAHLEHAPKTDRVDSEAETEIDESEGEACL